MSIFTHFFDTINKRNIQSKSLSHYFLQTPRLSYGKWKKAKDQMKVSKNYKTKTVIFYCFGFSSAKGGFQTYEIIFSILFFFCSL